MRRKTIVATAGIALLLGAATGLITHLSGETPPPNDSGHAVPSPAPQSTDQRQAIEKEKALAQARAAAEKYIAAITARDEAAAARFTCRGTDAGLLWISAVGRKIRVVDVDVVTTPTALRAFVTIHVDGEPPSSLVLTVKDGNWCVWP